MLAAGIDCGAKTTKVVLVKDNKVLAQALELSGFDQKLSAETALAKALLQAEVRREELDKIIATGAGRKAVTFANDMVTEISADAKGIGYLNNLVHTVIDVGAEEGRAIRLGADGKVMDFAINEKCAAGAGAFTEAMARALEVELEELGPLSLKSQKAVPMNAQCTVFAESEVVTLVHSKTPKEDIARAIHDAIASRITAMVRRLVIEHDVALIGGMAYNIGFVDSLKRDLNVDNLYIPQNPEFVGALGAALQNL